MITVIAKLDKSSRARLSWIQSFAASFGIVPRPIYGHIAIASIPAEEVDSISSQDSPHPCLCSLRAIISRVL